MAKSTKAKAKTKAKVLPHRAALGLKLRTMRLKKGWTLRYVAEHCDLSYEAVRLVELGRGGLGAFNRLADLLNMSKAERSALLLKFVGG